MIPCYSIANFYLAPEAMCPCLIRTLGTVQNLVLKIFGQLRSGIAYWILIAAKNYIKLFGRTIPVGNTSLICIIGTFQHFWSTFKCHSLLNFDSS